MTTAAGGCGPVADGAACVEARVVKVRLAVTAFPSASTAPSASETSMRWPAANARVGVKRSWVRGSVPRDAPGQRPAGGPVSDPKRGADRRGSTGWLNQSTTSRAATRVAPGCRRARHQLRGGAGREGERGVAGQRIPGEVVDAGQRHRVPRVGDEPLDGLKVIVVPAQVKTPGTAGLRRKPASTSVAVHRGVEGDPDRRPRAHLRGDVGPTTCAGIVGGGVQRRAATAGSAPKLTLKSLTRGRGLGGEAEAGRATEQRPAGGAGGRADRQRIARVGSPGPTGTTRSERPSSPQREAEGSGPG